MEIEISQTLNPNDTFRRLCFKTVVGVGRTSVQRSLHEIHTDLTKRYCVLHE